MVEIYQVLVEKGMLEDGCEYYRLKLSDQDAEEYSTGYSEYPRFDMFVINNGEADDFADTYIRDDCVPFYLWSLWLGAARISKTRYAEISNMSELTHARVFLQRRLIDHYRE